MKGDVSELVLTPDLIKSIRKDYFCLITNDQAILKRLSEHFDVSEYLKDYHVNEHKVTVTDSYVRISCFKIEKHILEGLLRLQKEGIILDSHVVGDIKIEDLNLIRYASNAGIIFGHINFYYRGYVITGKEIQEWIS